MRSFVQLSCVLLLPLFAVGCGGSSGGPQPQAATTAGQPSVPSDPAARVVYEFLDAIRQGQPDSGRFLTPLALKTTQEVDFVFAPPASSTASFAVGEVIPGELPSEVGVLSLWKDVDADGKPYEEEIIWGVKLTDGQWQIAGMGFQTDPQANEPLMFSFEVKEDLLRAAQMASPSPEGQSTTPQPTDKVARDPFQQPAQR